MKKLAHDNEQKDFRLLLIEIMEHFVSSYEQTVEEVSQMVIDYLLTNAKLEERETAVVKNILLTVTTQYEVYREHLIAKLMPHFFDN